MGVKRDATDKAFSDCLREAYDYTCQHCGYNGRHEKGSIHLAHVHTRLHRSTRWNAEYGATVLCAKCHWRFTNYPLEWADFIRKEWGDANYDEAKRLAWATRKYTKEEQKEIRKHYQTEKKRIEAARKEGAEGVIPCVSYD